MRPDIPGQRDLSILVISYNTRELTLECLESVHQQTQNISFEVIVVDNDSDDGSAEAIAREFPQVNLHPLKDNLGFAGANNYAAEHARGDWILLLNPDTVVLDGAIDKLMAFASSREDASIFGGRTLFADRSLNATSVWGRPTPWSTFCFGLGLCRLGRYCEAFDSEAMRGWQRDEEREVDIVSGCFFLIRKRDWQKLDGFDPEFFMYGEDFDLCLRARSQDMKARFCPDATIIHYGGASERVKPDQIVKQLRAKRGLIRKHWSRPMAHVGVALLRLRVLTRAVGFRLGKYVRPSVSDRADSWRQAWVRRREWLTQ